VVDAAGATAVVVLAAAGLGVVDVGANGCFGGGIVPGFRELLFAVEGSSDDEELAEAATAAFTAATAPSVNSRSSKPATLLADTRTSIRNAFSPPLRYRFSKPPKSSRILSAVRVE